MIFNDRKSAAFELLNILKNYTFSNAVVLGIPRGGIPIAEVISNDLQAPLGAILVHKISFPDNEEYAIGCVGLSGNYHIQKKYADIPRIRDLVSKEVDLLREKRGILNIPDVDIKNKTVFIVDDGIATGETIRCAIDEVKHLGAEKIILAVPVCSMEAFNFLSTEVDEFFTLHIPRSMMSVGEFYREFNQVTDEEVKAIFLKKNNYTFEISKSEHHV